MRVSIWVAAALAVLTGCGPAAGFSGEVGHWTVFAQGSGCLGFNRPPAEYNYSPWNTLTLTAPRAGGVLVGVQFWPGLLAEGQRYWLTLTPEDGKPLAIDAEAGPGIGLRSVEPVPEAVLKALAGGAMLTAEADGVTLGFDTSHLGTVLAMLEDCRKTLGE